MFNNVIISLNEKLCLSPLVLHLLGTGTHPNSWIDMSWGRHPSGTLSSIILLIIPLCIIPDSKLNICVSFCCYFRVFTASWWRFLMRMIIHLCFQKTQSRLLLSVRYRAFKNTRTQISACVYYNKNSTPAASSASLSVCVFKLTAVNTVVFTVQATDADNDNIIYSIDQASVSCIFLTFK